MSEAACPVAGLRSSENKTASLLNSFRLDSLMKRLSDLVRVTRNSDTKEFQSCCISLTKGIDFAIANNDIPRKGEEFPQLLKQVHDFKNERSVVLSLKKIDMTTRKF